MCNPWLKAQMRLRMQGLPILRASAAEQAMSMLREGGEALPAAILLVSVGRCPMAAHGPSACMGAPQLKSFGLLSARQGSPRLI